jgi:hypothetical protein
MTKRQLVVMWVAIALLVATWLYPPWVSSRYGYDSSNLRERHKIWYSYWAPLWGEHGGLLSYQRLALEDAIIVVLAAGVIVSFRKRI